MKKYVSNPEFLEDTESSYDLYAVINHYGIITAGHYTCMVKNEEKQTWYQYDDSSCQQISEREIRSSMAYILFYKRRDLEKKQSI